MVPSLRREGRANMVRRRVELRRIEDKGKRTASFSKRRSGLMKKAEELAVLCDAEVAVIIFSPLGKLSCFSNRSSVEPTIQRYYEFSDAERNVRKCNFQRKNCHKGSGCSKTNNEILEIAQRLSDQRNVTHLNQEGLDNLERELEKGLRQISHIKEMMPGSIQDINQHKLNSKVSNNQHHGDNSEGQNKDNNHSENSEAADTTLSLWWPPYGRELTDNQVEAVASMPILPSSSHDT